MTDEELTVWTLILTSIVVTLVVSAVFGWVLMLVLGALGVSWPFIVSWAAAWLAVVVTSNIGRNHAR